MSRLRQLSIARCPETKPKFNRFPTNFIDNCIFFPLPDTEFEIFTIFAEFMRIFYNLKFF